MATDIHNATIILGSDGSYVDASPPALSMLGISLAELRALPPGALAAEQMDEAERAALSQAFAQAGARSAVGAATIRRPDGRRLRVEYLIDLRPDGTYVAHLKQAETALEQPTIFVSAGDVLAAWRATERRLETLSPESSEAKAAQSEIQFFRDEYQRLASPKARRGH